MNVSKLFHPTFLARYLVPASLIIGGTAFIKGLFPGTDELILVMVYLLSNVVVAVRCGQGPAVFSNLASILAFDYYFVEPHFAFTPVEAKYYFIFLIMFLITIFTSRLAIQSRLSSAKAQREEMMSSLLSAISHDLRTPLTSLVGAASTLVSQDDKMSPDDRKRMQETICEESQRLSRLVNNVLQITKVESEHMHLNRDWCSLEDIIGSVLDRLAMILKERSVVTTLPADLPLVFMDDVLVEQVLINLLENAARYTPSGSGIEIAAAVAQSNLLVEILDRGAGVALEDRERIFEKFCRGANATVLGSGLGLAICRGIIRAHGGMIGVKPRAGGGSVFWFTLPLSFERGMA